MYRVPFGDGEINFEFPPQWRAEVIEPRTASPLQDVQSEVKAALANPLGSPRISQCVKAGSKVCIVFTDSTRSCHESALVPHVLSELESAGVYRQDITFLCAVGMHRASTYEEKVGKLGRDIVESYRVLDHEAGDPGQLIKLGSTGAGVPVSVNRAVYEADFVVSTGVVEPHQYAGYSGGWKTVAIGAGGEDIIGHTHSPVFVEDPGTRLGSIDGNPFHAAICEAARRAGLDFIVNVIQDGRKQDLFVRSGAPGRTFEELVRLAGSVYEVPVSRKYDVVVGGVGAPKDANLYQASRAASYIFFARTCVLKPGATIIVPARCGQGVGEGVGEKRFFKAMSESRTVGEVLREGRSHGYKPGQQRAFVIAKVLEHNSVIVVGAENPELVRAAKFNYASSMEDAFRTICKRKRGKLEAAVLPHALLTLPVLQEG